MPTEDNVKVVKNVEFSEKKKTKKIKEEYDEEDKEEEEHNEEENEDEDEDEDDDDDDDDDDDEEDDDEEDDDVGLDGLTDLGLYNIMGQYFVDDEGNTVGSSLSTIAKELGKLNHIIKKYVSKN
jgi:hypothetical protein